MAEKIYIIGSLRNPRIPEIAEALRKDTDAYVFDDWYSAGPKADDHWRDHQQFKGLSYIEALRGPAARSVYNFDKRHLDESDAAVLVLPAGKSGHLELGYCAGRDKDTYILFDGQPDPERWDVMYQFATKIFFSVEEMLEHFKLEDAAVRAYQSPNFFEQ